ncbi:hypothetical protein JF732_25725 [Mycobacterium intracellulare]|nr:hypothetical protein [Mycobacterium intracellulare]MCA2343915.1 hypothetical protein [Mycobacterium intracellulare]
MRPRRRVTVWLWGTAQPLPRHTYASLCAAVPAISVRQVAEWMGHANPTTTELVYTHLYTKADHDDEMAALGALATTPNYHGDNVIPLHG